MSRFTERAAQEHPAYNDSLRRAAAQAATGLETAVYFDGTAMYVRSAYAPKVAHADIVCVAQLWDDKTVQLRFAGARSEWVKL